MTNTSTDISTGLQPPAARSSDAIAIPENLLSDDWSRPEADLNGIPLSEAPENPTAAGYTREACHDPASASHARQIAAIEGYVANAGLRMKTLYSDLGTSGMARRRRPLFEAMMEDARKHGFRHLVVEDLDRISRSSSDLLEIYEELCSHGIELHDTRHGRLDLAQVLVVGYLGAEDSARFGHLCREGRRKAAAGRDAVRKPSRGPRKR